MSFCYKVQLEFYVMERKKKKKDKPALNLAFYPLSIVIQN